MPILQSSFETLKQSLRGGFMTKFKGETASCAPDAGFATSALAVSFPKLALSAAVALTLGMGLGVTDASAQQYWDGPGNPTDSVVQGGTGTWDDTGTKWTDVGGVANADWNDGDAVFGGAAGTVTVSGTQTVTGITFDTSGYTVTGGTLAVGSGTIDSGSGTAEISSTLTGAGMTKVGTGILTISGTTDITGSFKVAEGGVVLGVGAFDDALSSIWVQDDIDPEGTQVTLDLGGNTVTTGDLIVNGLGTTELSNGTVDFSGTADIWFATVSADLTGSGDLVKSGSGTATLEGTNTYTGSTLVRQRTLSLAAGSSITSTTVTIGDASTTAKPVLIAETNTLATGTNLTIDTSAGFGGEFRNEGHNTIATLNTSDADAEVTLNGGTLTITGGGTMAGVVQGVANLINDGGTLTLSGANTATGRLTNTLGSTVELSSWSGSIINLGDLDIQGNLAMTGRTFENYSTGKITNSGNATLALTGITTFTSVGSINAGSGTITITADNFVYQDGHTEVNSVTINAATLTEERTGAGGTYSGGYGAANLATNAAGVFTTGGDTTTTGNFTHDSTGLVTVADGHTLTAATITNSVGSGGISVGAASTLEGTGNTLNNNALITVAAGGTVTDAGAINNNAGGGVITFTNGGTLAADTDNSGDSIVNTGDLNINGGTVVASSGSGGGTIQNSGAGTIDIAAGATLTANNAIANSGTAAIDIAAGANLNATAGLTNTSTAAIGVTLVRVRT